MTTKFTHKCAQKLRKNMYSPNDSDYDAKQNINNVPNKTLIHVLSFLNTNDKVNSRNVNKEFNIKALENTKQHEFTYDGKNDPNIHKFKKMIKSDVYQYCTALIMPRDFNDFIILPENLHTFYMGYNFDQPIRLPRSLHTFNMGEYFNRPIKLPENLHMFYMGYDFNQPIILPKNLHIFFMGYQFNQPITLPHNLHTFTMGYDFNQHITLPKNLHKFYMGSYFNQPITISKNTKIIKNSIYNSQIKYYD